MRVFFFSSLLIYSLLETFVCLSGQSPQHSKYIFYRLWSFSKWWNDHELSFNVPFSLYTCTQDTLLNLATASSIDLILVHEELCDFRWCRRMVGFHCRNRNYFSSIHFRQRRWPVAYSSWKRGGVKGTPWTDVQRLHWKIQIHNVRIVRWMCLSTEATSTKCPYHLDIH